MHQWLGKIKDTIKAAPKLPTILGLAYWVLINLIYTWNYFQGKASLKFTLIYKTLSLIAAILFANLIANLIRKAKKDNLYKTMLKRTLIYFGVALLFILLTWPGLYVHDDIVVLRLATELRLEPWQHALSSLHMIISISLIPIASAPIIFQSIFGALIASYVSTFLPTVLSKDKNKQHKISIALFAIFFLPPVILHVICGYRMSIYQYFEVFVLAYLYIHYKKAEKIKTFAMLSLLFIIILLCSWRSEAIYYILGLPILFFIIRKPLFTLKQIAIYSLIIIVATLGIGRINSHLVGNNSYTFAALLVPINGIIDGAIEENDTETLESYNRIFDIECIKENGLRKAPEAMYWTCTRSLPEDTMKELTTKTIQLAPKYISYIAPQYADIFCDVYLGVQCGPSNTGQTGAHFISDWSNYYFSEQADEKGISFEKTIDLPLKSQISRPVRAATVNFLTGRNPITNTSADYPITKERYPTHAIPVYYQLFYSLIMPTIAIIAAAVISIRRKKYVLLWIILLIAGRAVIVSATGMASYLMYFMPYYISSLVFFVVALFEQSPKKKAAPKKATAKKKK